MNVLLLVIQIVIQHPVYWLNSNLIQSLRLSWILNAILDSILNSAHLIHYLWNDSWRKYHVNLQETAETKPQNTWEQYQ